MATDASPPADEEVKGRKRSKRKVQRKTADIEELTSAGHKALQEGRPKDALTCFREALKTAEQLQDSRVLRACSFNLGAAYVEAGRPQKGLDLLRQVLPGPKAERLPDLQFNLALAHKELGQNQEAAAGFLQAAQLYRSQGDGGSEGETCMEMGRCYSRTQDWAQATQGFQRAAESYRVAAMLDSAAIALKEAGSHMSQSDQFSHDDIRGVLAECLSLTDSITDPRMLGELYLSVGVSYCQLRCFQEAEQCFQRALTPAAPFPPLLARVLHNLGAALNSLGQFTPAVGYHRLAGELYGSLGCRGDQARCFSNLAFAFGQLGDEEEAAESFILALQGFKDTADYPAQVQVCESLAECYLRQRKQQKAVQLYKQALSAVSHCQESEGVQDRLVERLLSIGSPRPRPFRPLPHSSPVRKNNMSQSPAANRHPVKPDTPAAAAGTGEEISGGPGAAEQRESAGGGVSGTPDYMSPAPGLHGSELSSMPRHTPEDPDSPGERWSDRGNLHTDSDVSLAQNVESPPTSPGDITESRMSRWRSRFCSVS